MSYYDNPGKQDIFQAAQQGLKQAMDAYRDMDPESPSYGQQLKSVMQEVNEAIQQIQTAIAYASEHQKGQLSQYLDSLQSILADINNIS